MQRALKAWKQIRCNPPERDGSGEFFRQDVVAQIQSTQLKVQFVADLKKGFQLSLDELHQSFFVAPLSQLHHTVVLPLTASSMLVSKYQKSLVQLREKPAPE